MKLDKILMLLMILHLCNSELISEGTAFVSGTAVLKCNVSLLNSLNDKDLIYYWQKDIDKDTIEVIFEISKGKRITEYIHNKHSNRTMELQPNWDLHIYNVTLDDQGIYSCHVSRNNNWAHSIFQLNVFEIHNPELYLIWNQSVESVTILELECKSMQCFPKPQGIIWKVFNNSGTHIIPGNVTIIQNENAKDFNISSAITLQIEGNATISCELQSVHNLTSNLLKIVENLPIEQVSHDLTYIGIGVAVGVVLVIVVTVWALASRRCVSSASIGPNHPTENELPLSLTTSDTAEQLEEQKPFMNPSTHSS